MEKSANCLAAQGQAGLKKNKCPQSTRSLWAGCCGLWAVWAWKILDHAIANIDDIHFKITIFWVKLMS